MGFEFRRGALPDVIHITPDRFPDERGYFLETFRQSLFAQNGIDTEFVQDNRSRSNLGVVRGLHYQLEPYAQGKLVSVISGAAWDVAVDIRKSSPTFGRSYGDLLSEENGAMLWIPPGFAHGFVALTEIVDLVYKCTAEYAPTHERGIRYDDPELRIEWPASDASGQPLRYALSPKDLALPSLQDSEGFS